jgi:SAM-dependent methyltransferase
MAEEAGASDGVLAAPAALPDDWTRVSTVYRPPGTPTEAFNHTFADHRDWLKPFFRAVPPGSEVLDLGCGCGTPDARILSERFRVTGVDISDVQVDRARHLAPQGRFVHYDLTEVSFPRNAFGGIVCLYSLVHLPLEDHPRLLAKVFQWLRPDGLFLVTTGAAAWTGVEDGWIRSNAKTYSGPADVQTYERWLRETGFHLLRRTFVPAKGANYALFLVQKRADPGPATAGRGLPA